MGEKDLRRSERLVKYYGRRLREVDVEMAKVLGRNDQKTLTALGVERARLRHNQKLARQRLHRLQRKAMSNDA